MKMRSRREVQLFQKSSGIKEKYTVNQGTLIMYFLLNCGFAC